MCVGDTGVQVAGPVGVVEGSALLEALGAHPPVAVPGGAPTLDADAVDHPVTGKPVPARHPRIGSVAQVPAVEFGRDGALDRQVELREFVGDRRVVVALKEVVGAEDGTRYPKWFAVI